MKCYDLVLESNGDIEINEYDNGSVKKVYNKTLYSDENQKENLDEAYKVWCKLNGYEEIDESLNEKNQKTDPNDDQVDSVEYFKKSINAREYFFPHKPINNLKEFQRKLLEMISMRQQDVIGSMTMSDKTSFDIGVLKAYKDIFELVLNFYQEQENKNAKKEV